MSNPFQELIDFAFSVYHEECAHCKTEIPAVLKGGRRESITIWAPRVELASARLQELQDACLRAGPRTGYPQLEIDRRVHALGDAAMGIVMWQRDSQSPKGDEAARSFVMGAPDRVEAFRQLAFEAAKYGGQLVIERGNAMFLAARDIRSVAASFSTNEEPRQQSKLKRRQRSNRAGEILLAFLETDNRHLNLSMGDLATQLKINKSNISRAFRHAVHGPKLMKLYQQYKVSPPTIGNI
jgi:hypothetical protein